MEAMPGHAGHTMATMANASVVTTMAMIVTNMTMGPDMNHLNGSVHHPTHIMPATNHGHHGHDHVTDNNVTMGHGNHSNHMNHNASTNNGNGAGHSHGTNGTAVDHDHGHGDTEQGDTHNHGNNGSEGHSGHGAAVHTMVFNFNLPLFVLFSEWEVATNGQLVGACIAWFLLAVVHEGFKNLRELILTRSRDRKSKYKAKNGSNGDENDGEQEKSIVRKMFDGCHIFLSFLQVVQTTLGMLLMLVYMTFNVYLAISISIGSGVGYWLFAWNRRTSNHQFDDDHCI